MKEVQRLQGQDESREKTAAESPTTRTTPERPTKDLDAEKVMKYAQEHPNDEEEDKDVQAGGASNATEETQTTQASAAAEATAVDHKRTAKDESAGPGSRRKVEHERTKRKSDEGEETGPAKQVRFDPDTQVPESSQKVAKKTDSSTATSSTARPTESPEMKQKGTVRRVVEKVELYDEDEDPEEAFGWTKTQLNGQSQSMEAFASVTMRRG